MSDTKRRKKDKESKKEKESKKDSSSKKDKKSKKEQKPVEEIPAEDDDFLIQEDQPEEFIDEFIDDTYDDVLDEDDKPKEPVKDYRCLHPDELVKVQKVLIEQTSELTGLPGPTCRLLLVHFKWDTEALQASYFDDPDSLFKKLGVVNPEAAQSLPKLKKGNHDCSICLCDYDVSEITQLPCGHIFCKACLAGYAADAIESSANVQSVICPDRHCKKQLDDQVISNLLKAQSSKTISSKFQRMLTNGYVMNNDHLKWCPGTDCTNAIQVALVKEPLVVCDCGTQFCFSCGFLPHAPATCTMMKEWDGKRSKDEANTKFLAAYTKNCPKCNFAIFKEGGCQYIRCTQCQHAFCWICMGAFDHVNHGCNAYNPVGDPTSARAQLAKYSHYLGRYEAHAQSVDLEQKLKGMAARTRDELQNQGFTYAEANFVFESLGVLSKARNLLKLTYVFGFYMPEKCPRQIFEHLQGLLEESVEKLSGLLESKNEKPDRTKILNLAANVKTQEENLMNALNDPTFHSAVAQQEDFQKYGKVDSSQYDGWIYTA